MKIQTKFENQLSANGIHFIQTSIDVVVVVIWKNEIFFDKNTFFSSIFSSCFFAHSVFCVGPITYIACNSLHDIFNHYNIIFCSILLLRYIQYLLTCCKRRIFFEFSWTRVSRNTVNKWCNMGKKLSIQNLNQFHFENSICGLEFMYFKRFAHLFFQKMIY